MHALSVLWPVRLENTYIINEVAIPLNEYSDVLKMPFGLHWERHLL